MHPSDRTHGSFSTISYVVGIPGRDFDPKWSCAVAANGEQARARYAGLQTIGHSLALFMDEFRARLDVENKSTVARGAPVLEGRLPCARPSVRLPISRRSGA